MLSSLKYILKSLREKNSILPVFLLNANRTHSEIKVIVLIEISLRNIKYQPITNDLKVIMKVDVLLKMKSIADISHSY